jgi:transposase
MIYTGIDWSDKSHWLCILYEAGDELDSFQISHGQDGFETAHSRIAKHANPEDVRVAIETKDSLLVDFLCELGYTLYFLNPRQTDRFRDRHRMSHSKSDSFDAYVLADAVRTDAHLFNALPPLDEASLRLRVLTRTREGLVSRKVAVQNEITAILGTWAGVSKAIATRHAIEAHAKLRQAQPLPSASVARSYPLAVRSLLRQLQSVLKEIEALEQEIRDTYGGHPNKELIESLPGVAETLGPVIAAELGADMARYSQLRTLKAFGGSSPVTQQSGQYRGIHFRRACNNHLRRALHLASQGAIRKAGWARELYDRLRADGKSYGRALRAVADQLIEMLYVILTKRTPYDEAYHLRMKALHGKA